MRWFLRWDLKILPPPMVLIGLKAKYLLSFLSIKRTSTLCIACMLIMSLISESQNNTLWETLSSHLVERCLHQEWGKGTDINFSFLQREREGVKIGVLGWFFSHNKGDNGGRRKITYLKIELMYLMDNP